MKFYAYHLTGVTSVNLPALGAESYTNQNHTDGADPAGVSYTAGFSSAADMYAMYQGALRHVKDAYLYYGGQLIKVLDTDDPTARPWMAEAAAAPTVGVCYKMMPQLNRVSGQANAVFDEQGTYYDIGNDGTVERFAWYKNGGSVYIGVAGTGLAASDTNYAIPYSTGRKSWRGTVIHAGTANSRTPDYTDGDYRAYGPYTTLNFNTITSANYPYAIPAVKDNLPDTAERLEIPDASVFELKDGDGKWKYARNATGTQAITTVANYVRYWLRKSVYPYAG